MRQAQIFEEHASVLPHWFSRGAREATLLYLDAHLDLQHVGDARIERLRQCLSADALSRLESPHPHSPDRERCFGIEDFLLPAARLGLVQRVVWVAPPHVLRGGFGAALAGLQQMEGVTVDDLESFRRVPQGWLCGHLLGVEITVCQLADLSRMAFTGQLLLDIDADYFLALPEDTIWIHPRQVLEALAAVPGIGNELTISRSVGTGFMPLRYRFIADHLAALWQGDLAATAHWDRLFDLVEEGRAPSRPATEKFAQLLPLHENNPQCAATCWALAGASDTADLRARYLRQAASLDGAYGDDLVRRLGEYQARWKPISLGTVLRLHKEVEAFSGTPERKAIAWVLLGQLYAVLGRVEEAQHCDRASLAFGGGHPDLALSIANLHLERGDFASAQAYLQRAAADDETRVGAWLQMAESAYAQREPTRAAEYAERACLAAPAWAHAHQRWAVFALAAGDAEAVGRSRQACEGLHSRLQAVAERLLP